MALQLEDYMAYSDAPSCPRNCLICESEIEPNYNYYNESEGEIKNNHKLWQRFRSLASRYLNLECSLNSNFNSNKINLTSTSATENCSQITSGGKVCCDNCLPEIESFCETYEEWEQLRLRIYQRSEVVAGLMKTRIKLEDFLSDGGGGEVDDDDDAADDPEGIQKFKKKFISRVKNNSKDAPHLRLKKIVASPRKKKKVQREDAASASTPIVVKVVIQGGGSVGGGGLGGVGDGDGNDPDFNPSNDGVTVQKKKPKPRQKYGEKCRFCNRFFDKKEDFMRHHKTHVQRLRREKAKKMQQKQKSMSTSGQRSSPKASSSTKPKSTPSPSPKTSTNSNRPEADVSNNLTMSVTDHGFVCKLCGQVFSDLDRLRIHVKRHKGELDFKCDVCGKAFGRNSHRKRHMKNLHGIDIYGNSDIGSISAPKAPNLRRNSKTSKGNKNEAQIRNQIEAAVETVSLTDNYYLDDYNNVIIDHYTNDDNDNDDVNVNDNGMAYYNENASEGLYESPENLFPGHYVKTEIENVDNFIDEDVD